MKKNIAEKLMGMNENSWQRHANPLSVYSRIFSFPLFALAFWSFNIWGITQAIVFTTVISLWLWINPRLFGVPQSTNNWASKVTFGERIWIKYDRSKIPIWHSVFFIYLLLFPNGLDSVTFD